MTVSVLTVNVAAKSYDLTDLATVKDELSIDPSDYGKDTFLSRSISQMSAAIANYTDRVLSPEAVTETVSPDYPTDYLYGCEGLGPISLSRAPVLTVLSVSQDGASLVAGTDYQVDYQKGTVTALSGIGCPISSWSLSPVTLSYIGGFGEVVATSTYIPTVAPFIATLADPNALDAGVTLLGEPMLAVSSAPAEGQYSFAAGVYTFNASDLGASIVVSSVSALIPLDIVDAALRLVTMRYKARGRDPMLMSASQPGMGDERYWVGVTPGQDGAFPPEIAGLLDRYRKVGIS